ncbi:GGDEF domain-containing protein [Egicoccus halophilus]|uniref:GGDEF domain-containing protein n=1 Tax=Egicoccus halophilus TaxID=1670830 RepID=A0A8J3A9X0_9ACTN|nr:GGDEF domain-containing protein [Egicoccus halophilus]GGI07982.1 hypothetical protein GCM10011354_26800 [Egicoccus halophilus]
MSLTDPDATVPGASGPTGGRRPWPSSRLGLLTLYGVSGSLCLYGALLPPTPVTPRATNAVLAGVAALVVTLVLARPWLPRRLVHGLLLLYSLGIGVSVGSAGTAAGAVASGISAVWVTLFGAICLGPRATRLHGLVAASALAVGLQRSVGGGAGWSAFAVVALSALVAGELLARAHGELRRLALTDPLTGASNRRGLERRGQRLLERARVGGALAAVVVDLDGFKQVNDRLGHAEGDRVLVELVAEWRRGIRAGDVLARIGGDEFVFLLPDTDAEAARQLLQRLRRASTGAWSFGVATSSPGDDLATLLARADADLYATRSGPPETSGPHLVP